MPDVPGGPQVEMCAATRNRDGDPARCKRAPQPAGRSAGGGPPPRTPVRQLVDIFGLVVVSVGGCSNRGTWSAAVPQGSCPTGCGTTSLAGRPQFLPTICDHEVPNQSCSALVGLDRRFLWRLNPAAAGRRSRRRAVPPLYPRPSGVSVRSRLPARRQPPAGPAGVRRAPAQFVGYSETTRTVPSGASSSSVHSDPSGCARSHAECSGVA